MISLVAILISVINHERWIKINDEIIVKKWMEKYWSKKYDRKKGKGQTYGIACCW